MQTISEHVNIKCTHTNMFDEILIEFMNSKRCERTPTQGKKRRFYSSYSYLQSRVLFAPPGHYASHHRLLSFDIAQFLFAVSEQSALGTFSSLLPPGLAALPRSAGFFSEAVFFTRMTLARCAFHGFPIGFRRCKRAIFLYLTALVGWKLEGFERQL